MRITRTILDRLKHKQFWKAQGWRIFVGRLKKSDNYHACSGELKKRSKKIAQIDFSQNLTQFFLFFRFFDLGAVTCATLKKSKKLKRVENFF